MPSHLDNVMPSVSPLDIPHVEQERQRIATLLRSLRKSASIDQITLAKRMQTTQATISRWENGKVMPAAADVKKVLHLLKADPEITRELSQSVALLETELRSWRSLFRAGWDQNQERIADAEATAREIRVFQFTVVPGLLQTDDYAVSLMQTYDATIPAGDIRASRIHRRQQFDDATKSFSFVVCESALRRRIAPESVMRDQMRYITDLSGQPNIEVAVLPLDARLTAIPLASFDLLDDRAVTMELELTEVVFRDEGDIARIRDRFDALRALSVTGKAADALLRTLERSFPG